MSWLPVQVERAIQTYQMFSYQERVLIAVSGGKDSLSLWDILNRLGYQADGLYIGLGIDSKELDGIGYSQSSLRMAEQFSRQYKLKLHVVEVAAKYGETIPQIAARTNRGKYKPCSVCGLAKRYIMNQVALESGYPVLATGHNLDDEAAILFGNTLNWLSGHLVRQWPVLEANQAGMVRKVKPLCRTYEREMAAYAVLQGIEYVYEECPHAVGSATIYYKEILNKMEFDRPGAKLNFYLTFLQAKKNGLFTPAADPELTNLHSCPNCGQPTTAPGICAFCRMVGKMHPQDEFNGAE